MIEPACPDLLVENSPALRRRVRCEAVLHYSRGFVKTFGGTDSFTTVPLYRAS